MPEYEPSSRDGYAEAYTGLLRCKGAFAAYPRLLWQTAVFHIPLDSGHFGGGTAVPSPKLIIKIITLGNGLEQPTTETARSGDTRGFSPRTLDRSKADNAAVGG